MLPPTQVGFFQYTLYLLLDMIDTKYLCLYLFSQEIGTTSSNIPPDVDDILHYIQAVNYGMNRVLVDKFPISLRFIYKEYVDIFVDK